MAVRKNDRRAAAENEEGLAFYAAWDLQKAVAAFQAAAQADDENPEYPLNLARAYARSGDFGQAMQALGDYLHCESKDEIAARYEQLFSSTLDKVELSLTDKMPKMKMTLPQIGKALQMWLEYRIVAGRRPLPITKPEPWAAAITYAVMKVNVMDVEPAAVAAVYGIEERPLQTKYKELHQTLDLMPGDYRYFWGEENPLDAVVAAGESEEASEILTELERRFKNG